MDRYMNFQTGFITSTSSWAMSTSSIPDMFIGKPIPYRSVILRISLKCEYCNVLQVRGKVKCPFCGAPYDEYLDMPG